MVRDRAAAALLPAALGAFAGASALHFLYGAYFWDPEGFSLGNDDAFITYRYAANLVEHGIVSFNPADSPPVEGYSNPLSLLLSALAHLLAGPEAVYPLMALAGGLAAALALLLIHRHAAPRHGPVAAGLAALTLALHPGLWINATSGLETPLVFLAQVWIWLRLAEHLERPSPSPAPGLLAASAVLVLLRTDGFTFPVFAATVLVLHGRLRLALLVLATAAAVFFGLMGLRWLYYGLPMPLPYYVKVSGGGPPMVLQALRELAGMALKSGFLVPALGLALATLQVLSGRPRLRRLPPDLLLAAAVLAYYLMLGGDIYRERFLLIVLAIGTLRFWILATGGPRPGLRAAAAAALAIVGLASAFRLDPRLDYRFEHPKYDRAVALGRFLAAAHPGTLLATAMAGKPPYYSGLPTIDILGLNDRHIALTEARGHVPGHAKWDAAYVFARRPGLICDHVFEDGNLPYGFMRAAYEARGYRLLYLVRGRDAAGEDILPVEGLTRPQVAGLVARGYGFGCIAAAGVAARPDPGAGGRRGSGLGSRRTGGGAADERRHDPRCRRHAQRRDRDPGPRRAQCPARAADRRTGRGGGGALRGGLRRERPRPCHLLRSGAARAGSGPARASLPRRPARRLLRPLDHLDRAALRGRQRDLLRAPRPDDLRRGDRPFRASRRAAAAGHPRPRRRDRADGGRGGADPAGLTQGAWSRRR